MPSSATYATAVVVAVMASTMVHAAVHNHHATTTTTTTSAAAQDRITHLPGFAGKVPFNQYAGYLNVDAKSNRNLFYWFVEAQKAPETAPLVLWLQGGPGCSSLIGMLSENGPFHADPDGTTVSLNPHSWNRIANMLYLEAPAGVGFSYSDNPADYTTGDAQTADDNYVALLAFFERHPNMNSTGRPFYLTGESYAGHYLPDLAARILLGNSVGSNPIINLKGFADGNPLTDLQSNFVQGTFPTYWNHALISQETHDGFVKDCANFPNSNAQCDHWQNVAAADMTYINPYDLYVPVCVSQQKQALAKALAPHHPVMKAYSQLPLGGVAPNGYDPCLDNHLTSYINRADVKEAIHAVASINWTECTNNLNFSQADVARSMVPFYEHFFKNSDLHILIYSGDVDSVCPYLGTQYWIENFNQKVVTDWKPWFYNKQVAGYYQKWEKIALATVRGAGHMVPEFRAPQAFELFQNYINGDF